MQHALFCWITQVLIIAALLQLHYNNTHTINKGSEYTWNIFQNTQFFNWRLEMSTNDSQKKEWNKQEYYSNNSFRMPFSNLQKKVIHPFWMHPILCASIAHWSWCICVSVILQPRFNYASCQLRLIIILCQSFWHSGETFSAHLKSVNIVWEFVMCCICSVSRWHYLQMQCTRYAHVYVCVGCFAKWWFQSFSLLIFEPIKKDPFFPYWSRSFSTSGAE